MSKKSILVIPSRIITGKALREDAENVMKFVARKGLRSLLRLVDDARGGLADPASIMCAAHGTITNGTVAPGFAFKAVGAIPARTGAGVYTLTADTGLGQNIWETDSAQCFVSMIASGSLAPISGGSANALPGTVTKTSTTVYGVATNIGTVAAPTPTDMPWDFAIFRFPQQT